MLFELRRYTIRRKFFTLLGAGFRVMGPSDEPLAYSRQKAFKLREDIRVFTREDMASELLAIRARQIVDFSAAYDVVDSVEGRTVGSARRKGWSSLWRDQWEIFDADERAVGRIQEDSTTLALLRRFLSNLIPQRFVVASPDGRSQAELRQRFNPFLYTLDVELEPGCPIDPRLVFAAAVLIAAIEGRQE